MGDKIVVTGTGIIGPCGNTVEEFINNLYLGKVNIKELSKSKYSEIRIGGKIVDFEKSTNGISRRLLNKCDDFSKISLIASKSAIEEAEISDFPLERIGIFIGNSTGGWNSSSTGLKNLFIDNFPVSPFMASNWFPAAVQGHLSLAYGFKGISKTLISDRTSGMLAIKHAIKNINSGKIDIALVGGVEAPINEWALHFYQSTDEVSIDGKYDFNNNSYGYLISEGAGFIVIETEKNALKRNAKIIAEIDGFDFKFYGGNDSTIRTEIYSNILSKILNGSNENLIIFPSAVGKIESDKIEVDAVKNQNLKDCFYSIPKLFFGNTIAAGSIMDIIISIYSMNKMEIPFGIETSFSNIPFDSLRKIRLSSEKFNKAIILSTGYEGTMAGISIKRRK